MPTDDADARALVDRLLVLLDLEEVGTSQVAVNDAPDVGAQLADFSATVFLGQSQRAPHGRIFGGQVLAQCVMAAGRTVQPGPGEPARPIHSLHAYFMRPGDDKQPIRFGVERMMDGRSFSTRRVHAIQHGRPILSMSASFQVTAGGLDHQDPMPQVPGPDGLPSLTDAFAEVNDPRAEFITRRPIELRYAEGQIMYFDQEPSPVAAQNVWMRAVASLPDDPLIHSAVLAYASDYSLLESVLRRHGVQFINPRLRIASLDHAMWFHRALRMDEWVLYAQASPSAQSGRGLGIGRVYATDGRLVASVAQEGMIRIKQA